MIRTFSPLPPLTLQQAENALHKIPANVPREVWASIAASLRSEFGELAFDTFDRWSAAGDTYNRRDAQDTWRSAGKRACTIGTLLHHAKVHGWTAPRRVPLTPSERARIERETIEAQRAREARNQIAAHALARSQANGATRAAGVWEACIAEPGTHPCLVAKKIGPHGAKRGLCDDAAHAPLCMPMRDIDGMLWSLQSISPDGKGKRYLPGSRTSGCFHSLGEPLATAKRIIVAEGFSTAASLAEHHAGAVIAAFSAGQLLNVGAALATRYPNAALVIAADFDSPAGGDGGPGVHYATIAAAALGAELWIPEAIPGRNKTDFSDWHILQSEQFEMEAA